MKKYLVVLSLFVTPTGAYAFSGDGSTPNGYIQGHTSHMRSSQVEEKLPDSFYHGDGSISNSYIHSKHLGIAKETHSIPMVGQGFMGDGSPANQAG